MNFMESREVITKQATLTIGLVGHVAHGKSSLVRALTGVQTTRFHKEKEQNITIKLGYANAKIYKCSSPWCPRPNCYRSAGSKAADEFPCDREGCDGSFQLVRHISFVDCPGHDSLMSTMLNGTAVMDAAIILVAANEPFPQPQTLEHLLAIEMMQLQNVIVVQNKIDLASSQEAVKFQQAEIRNFLNGTCAEKAPIIPCSAQFNCNLDVICDYLANSFEIPKRDLTTQPRMSIIRSFDINKPGLKENIAKAKGGVLGGSVTQGVLRAGQAVEVRPGLVSRDNDGNPVAYRPIFTKIGSMLSEQKKLEQAYPGGLIGVGTTIDPNFCQADRLTGHIMGAVGSLPDVFVKLEADVKLLKNIQGRPDAPRVEKLKRHEALLLNIGAQRTTCRVISVANNKAKLALNTPICSEIGNRIAISRQIGSSWRLIGQGKVLRGIKLDAIF